MSALGVFEMGMDGDGWGWLGMEVEMGHGVVVEEEKGGIKRKVVG